MDVISCPFYQKQIEVSLIISLSVCINVVRKRPASLNFYFFLEKTKILVNFDKLFNICKQKGRKKGDFK